MDDFLSMKQATKQTDLTDNAGQELHAAASFKVRQASHGAV